MTRTRKTSRKDYIVRDKQTTIPLSNQEYMTLTQAVARYDRECEEAERLFGEERAKGLFEIYDMRREKVVL